MKKLILIALMVIGMTSCSSSDDGASNNSPFPIDGEYKCSIVYDNPAAGYGLTLILNGNYINGPMDRDKTLTIHTGDYIAAGVWYPLGEVYVPHVSIYIDDILVSEGDYSTQYTAP